MQKVIDTRIGKGNTVLQRF